MPSNWGVEFEMNADHEASVPNIGADTALGRNTDAVSLKVERKWFRISMPLCEIQFVSNNRSGWQPKSYLHLHLKRQPCVLVPGGAGNADPAAAAFLFGFFGP